ncbi:hypothetical protein GCM10008931_42380 [Oceanobacillus oncorhynchi subsp. oncorhynchi]
MLTIGYTGNGKSTNRYHLPFVLQRENIKVKTIYRRTPANDSWDKHEGIQYISDLDEVLQDEKIQLIVICTKHDSHFEYAKRVLEHNKHCLVEKPLWRHQNRLLKYLPWQKRKGLLYKLIKTDVLTVIFNGAKGN